MIVVLSRPLVFEEQEVSGWSVVACVRSQVALSLFDDFAIEDMAEPGTFAPARRHRPSLERLLGELTAWAGALRSLRAEADTALSKPPVSS